MANSNSETPAAEALPVETPVADAVAEVEAGARARFAKALDEARAGAVALGKDAVEISAPYREKLAEAFSAKSGEWLDEAKVLGEQALDKASTLAGEGKAKASDALAGLGKLVADNAGLVDGKLGVRCGEVARTAARQIQETAASLDSHDFAELGEEALAFVRKRPVVALGMAALTGYLVARVARAGRKAPAPALPADESADA